MFDKETVGQGGVKPFNALMTARSATVGTGNIAGVATAIALGGPGAIFCMWLVALFGMATKCAETVCAVACREVNATGRHVGGSMCYLRNGVGEFAPELGKWLGIAFAVFGAIARSASTGLERFKSTLPAIGATAIGIPMQPT